MDQGWTDSSSCTKDMFRTMCVLPESTNVKIDRKKIDVRFESSSLRLYICNQLFLVFEQ